MKYLKRKKKKKRERRLVLIRSMEVFKRMHGNLESLGILIFRHGKLEQADTCTRTQAHTHIHKKTLTHTTLLPATCYLLRAYLLLSLAFAEKPQIRLNASTVTCSSCLVFPT